jgi:hypothetical protein
MYTPRVDFARFSSLIDNPLSLNGRLLQQHQIYEEMPIRL